MASQRKYVETCDEIVTNLFGPLRRHSTALVCGTAAQSDKAIILKREQRHETEFINVISLSVRCSVCLSVCLPDPSYMPARCTSVDTSRSHIYIVAGVSVSLASPSNSPCRHRRFFLDRISSD